jgi:hypothetical protein
LAQAENKGDIEIKRGGNSSGREKQPASRKPSIDILTEKHNAASIIKRYLSPSQSMRPDAGVERCTVRTPRPLSLTQSEGVVVVVFVFVPIQNDADEVAYLLRRGRFTFKRNTNFMTWQMR